MYLRTLFIFFVLGSLIEAFRERTGERALNHLRQRRDIDYDDESSSSGEAEFLKFFIGAAWKEGKQEVLTSFIEELASTYENLTIIGWHRVAGDDGEVKEIRTVQLVIPPKPEDENDPNIVDDDDDDDDDEEDDGRLLPHKDIKEMREIFKPMATMGIPASVTREEFDKEGKNTVLMYIDKDELYVKAEGFAIYNKTAEASAEQVEDFVKGLKPSLVDNSVLRYDVDGHLDLKRSTIHPQALASVLDYYEATDKMLSEGPQIMAEISAQFPQKQIPKELAARYNQAYPEYTWRVLVDPSSHYITRDVWISLSYDNFDFDEDSDISYLVYGIKKTSRT